MVTIPHKADRLACTTNPTNQPGEEEAEAEGDDGVAPEHVSVEEPVDRDGGGEDPGHVADQDTSDHLKGGRVNNLTIHSQFPIPEGRKSEQNSILSIHKSKALSFCDQTFLVHSKNKIPQEDSADGWCRISHLVRLHRHHHRHHHHSRLSSETKTTTRL